MNKKQQPPQADSVAKDSYASTLFTRHKSKLDSYLVGLIQEHKEEYQDHYWSKELFDYLEAFIQQGKSIRGVLIMQLVELLGAAEAEDVLPLAAYVELVHAGLLIQDDIMDKDSVRRGLPTLHTTYHTYGKENSFLDADLFGKSLAICVSDICFFIGFKQLSQLSLQSKITREVVHQILLFANQEYIHVGFAQLEDVHLANLPSLTAENGTKDVIESIYLYKTARYTFSLPLGLAARYANLDAETVSQLERIGDTIGLLFQIRDDYLAMFGEESVTGKPVGTDITENKHTFYKLYLFQALKKHADVELSDQIQSLFGKPEIEDSEIRLVQDSLHDLGVINDIDAYRIELSTDVEELIATSNLDPSVKEFLSWLANFVVSRKK